MNLKHFCQNDLKKITTKLFCTEVQHRTFLHILLKKKRHFKKKITETLTNLNNSAANTAAMVITSVSLPIPSHCF